MLSMDSRLVGFLFGIGLLLGLSAGTFADTPANTLEPFGWGQIKLLPGPLKDAFDTNVRYMHTLTPDRYLWTFRQTAGLPTPNEPYGGWEEPKCELRGHSIGHYLSACARIIVQTGDPVLKKNAEYTVAELAKCQAKNGKGYLSAFPEELFDRVDRCEKVWAPYYTIHKIMLGLWEMYAYAGNEQALDVLKGMADYFKGRCDKLNDEQMQKMLNNEFGGMHEVLLNLYSSTKDKKYLDLAQRFVKRKFIDAMAQGKDALPGIHANTHIPQIAGQARAYELTGDAGARKIVEFFWQTLVSAHTYATGGSNMGEYWSAPNKLADTLTANNQEFCTAYNFEKICRYLLKWTGDPRYADMIERNYYNGILVSQEPQTGMFIYYLPMKTGLHKDHGNPFHTFTCCYGTGIQEYGSLAQDLYYHTGDALYVNLFVPSTVEWKSPAGPVTLTQQTDYPATAASTLKVSLAKEAAFKLVVRVPWWIAQGMSVKVNGAPVPGEPKAGTWLTIDRTWKDGDTVELAMPMSLHVKPMNDDPNFAAILYGPMVLAGLIEKPAGPLELPAPVFTGDLKKPQDWIKPVEGKALTFRTTGQPVDLTFIPIHKVVHENYGLYWRFVTAGSPALANFEQAMAAIPARQQRVIDLVHVGEEGSERGHKIESKSSNSGNHAAGKWRDAAPDGFFSYTLKVDPAKENTLAVTYWGSDDDGRIFEILVEGTRVATQTLNRNAPERLFTVEYAIPKELLAGKKTVVVRFQAAPKCKTIGSVFGVETLRKP